MRFLEKLSDILSFLRPLRTENYRTLVLVGSRGETISIKRFLGLIIVTTCISIVTLVAIVYLFISSNGLRTENKELKEALTQYQDKVKYLKNENDILMARLVAGSEGGLFPANEQESQTNDSSKAPSSTDVPDQLNIEEEIKEANRQLKSDHHLKKTIEVENLIVTHETNSKTLRVRFDLRNMDPDLNPISGRTVVILKTGDQVYNNWLTLPFVPLVSGKPASMTTGRTFLISRFKTVKFSIAAQANPNRFKSATVFVFSKTGEQLLEKDFKIEIKKDMASSEMTEPS